MEWKLWGVHEWDAPLAAIDKLTALTFSHAPGVLPAPDPLPVDLDDRVAADYSQRQTILEGEDAGYTPHGPPLETTVSEAWPETCIWNHFKGHRGESRRSWPWFFWSSSSPPHCPSLGSRRFWFYAHGFLSWSACSTGTEGCGTWDKYPETSIVTAEGGQYTAGGQTGSARLLWRYKA